MKTSLLVALTLLANAIAVPLAAQERPADKPPVFKHATLELQDGGKHRAIGGVVRLDADALVFTAYGLLQDKHDRTLRYDQIARAQFTAGEAPSAGVAVAAPTTAMALGHRKYLTITMKDGSYTLLQLDPSTHMVALIELERRAHLTIAR